MPAGVGARNGRKMIARLQVNLAQCERHRLIGLSDYGIVAEIWQHTSDVPSDESDMVRVQDDFDRK